MTGTTTIINGRFTVGKVLGAGMQGEVRRGVDNNSNKTVALKIVDKSKLRKRSWQALEREVEIMKAIRHPNVLRLRAVAMDTVVESKRAAVLVLEIAEGGELFEFLMHTKHFEEVLARTYFRQLISALKCCHEQNIYHRDIKPENVLLSSDYELKLADFGLGNLTEDEDDFLETECGTRSYMAPEILAHTSYRGDCADVWSAGVVLFIMLTGSPPFEVAIRTDWWFNACALSRHDRFWAAHLRGAAHMTELTDAQDFLNKIFVPNPKNRITIEEMSNHPWFQGPILDEGTLKEVMHKRFLQLEAIKVKERATLKRQAGVKRGLGSVSKDRKGSVDVFKRDTHRSVDKPLPVYQSSVLNPVYGESNSAAYQFYAHYTEDILQCLTKAVLREDSAAKVMASPDSYSLDARLRLPGEEFELDGERVSTSGESLHVTLNAFREDDCADNDLVIITVGRKSGMITSFQKLYEKIRNHFIGEVDVGSDFCDGIVDSAEDCLEEEELKEDIGMI